MYESIDHDMSAHLGSPIVFSGRAMTGISLMSAAAILSALVSTVEPGVNETFFDHDFAAYVSEPATFFGAFPATASADKAFFEAFPAPAPANKAFFEAFSATASANQGFFEAFRTNQPSASIFRP